MSGSLRAARGRTMDRDTEHVREVSEQSDKSNIASKSDNECGSDTDCLGCAPFSCARHDPNSNYYTGNTEDRSLIIGNDVIATAADYIERDYNEYTATIRSQGQGDCSGVWLSDESRNLKHSNSATTADVEYITGIQSGTTI